MLRTQMFPRLPERATVVADTKFVSKTQKMFLIFVRNILCPQQIFPRLSGMDTKQMFCVPLVCPPKKHHVSATMCPRLPPPIQVLFGINPHRDIRAIFDCLNFYRKESILKNKLTSLTQFLCSSIEMALLQRKVEQKKIQRTKQSFKSVTEERITVAFFE